MKKVTTTVIAKLCLEISNQKSYCDPLFAESYQVLLLNSFAVKYHVKKSKMMCKLADKIFHHSYAFPSLKSSLNQLKYARVPIPGHLVLQIL